MKPKEDQSKILIIMYSLAVIIFIIVMAVITSCAPMVVSHEDRTESRFSRIEVSEETIKKGSYYTLLSVDGHEYLTRYRGGFIHIVSCKLCKP